MATRISHSHLRRFDRWLRFRLRSFQPRNKEHGGLDSKIRHLGDLGNISSEKGVSKGRISTDTLSLVMGKTNCIVGRMIIVHADRDDLGKGGLNARRRSH